MKFLAARYLLTMMGVFMLSISPDHPVAADSCCGGQSVQIPNTASHDFYPQVMDVDLKLFVSVPNTPPPENGFPVLYAFDANLSFPSLAIMAQQAATQAIRAEKQPAIVVAIGYAEPGISSKRRVYDLTPPSDAYTLPKRPNGKPWPKLGGGAIFRDTLINEIKPFISSNYPINPNEETLVGHSLGGLLTLYILASRPDAFERYVAASPSLWFNNRKIMKDLVDLQSRTLDQSEKQIPLRLTVGGDEESLSPWSQQNEKTLKNRKIWLQHNQMIENAQNLAADLQAINGIITLSFEVYSGLDHMAASLPAYHDALRLTMDPNYFQNRKD